MADGTETTDGPVIPNFQVLLPENSAPKEGDAHPPEPDIETVAASAEEAPEESASIAEIEQQLADTHLSEHDLNDLNAAAAAFPEIDAKSVNESKTDYPYSGRESTFDSPAVPYMYSFSGPASVAQAAGVPGADAVLSTGLAQPNKRPRYCVDLRGKNAGLYTFRLASVPMVNPPEWKSDAVEFFQCSQDDIREIQRTRQPPVSLLVIGAGGDNLHMIVNHKEREATGCLMIGRDSSLTSGLKMCRQWLEETLAVPSPPQICLLRKGEKLCQPQTFLNCQDFEEVDLLRAETLTLKFLLRLSQRSEKAVYVDCFDTDNVWELKEKVLQVFASEGERVCDSRNSMWLTCGDRVLPDGELLRNMWDSRVDELGYSMESNPTVDLANEAIQVHFQPADAVLVKLNFKSDTRKYLKSESVLLLSPRSSVQTVRLEIAKVLHKDPHSFKMFIGGKKIEMKTVLEPFLRTPNCTVVVEQRAKIQLNIVNATNQQQSSSVLIHRYEGVWQLRQQVCSWLELPGYCVDLQHDSVDLKDHLDIRTSRLRHGDTVSALVLPNRTRVSVRLASGHWEDVVIDDVTVSTVEQLKAYADIIFKESSPGCKLRAKNGKDDPNSYNLSAILNGQLLPDSSTLREAGVEMDSRLVLIQQPQFGYTVSPPGRVPLFFSSDSHNYQPAQRVMAMCDGKKFYFNDQENSTDDPVIYPSSTQSPPSGMGPCTRQLQAQFPPRQPDQDDLQQRKQEQPSFVCHVCKSESMPSFPSSSDYERPSMRHSQSDTFHNQTASLSNEEFQRDIIEKRSSTPLQSNSNPTQPSPFQSSPLRSSPVYRERLNGDQIRDSVDGSSLHFSGTSAGNSAMYFSDSAAFGHTRGRPPRLVINTASAGRQSLGETNKSQMTVSGEIQQQRNGQQMWSLSGTATPPPLSTTTTTNTNTTSQLLTPDTAGTCSPGNFQVAPFAWNPDRTRHTSECSETQRSVRTINYQENWEHDPNGNLVSTTLVQSRQRISPEMVKAGYSPRFGPGYPPHYPLPPYQHQAALPAPGSQVDAHGLPQHDTTFDYIKQNIVWTLARNLGREGPSVMRQLVPDRIIHDADQKYHNEPCEKHYYCLTKWCQMKGSKATVEDLKKVLKNNDRTDLAEELDRIEAKEQGYETAP